MVSVSGKLLMLFGLLGTLLLGGCMGWKTGGRSNGISGLKVHLWVGQAEGEGAFTLLINKIFLYLHFRGIGFGTGALPLSVWIKRDN